LASNKNCVLPEFLKIHSPLLKQALNELDKNPETRRMKNVKRSAAILSNEDKIVYVDYVYEDKVKKQYEIHEKSIKIDKNQIK
jgi:hypothetical protein